MKSVKPAVAVTRSAIVGLGSVLGALADWAEEHAGQAARILTWMSVAFCLGFFGTLAVNNLFHSPSRPVEAVSPSTVQAPTSSTATITKVIEVIKTPTQLEASRPADKDAMVRTTEVSQPSSQESSAPATLPSTSTTSASVPPSASSSPELPPSTTSASSTTTSTATNATSSTGK